MWSPEDKKEVGKTVRPRTFIIWGPGLSLSSVENTEGGGVQTKS